MRRLENYKEPVLWSMTSFERLKFAETNIISNLLEDNVVGSGESGKIYKVQLDNLDFSVAVKQMWNSENIDNGHFLAEVKILGTIRHRNIVKLLCCITSYNSKLLVYEYLENQGLDRWLYGRTRLGLEGGDTQRVLEWSTRLKIAIGAAQGLCYMHHDCFPPIIHRDIKSSNILLDSEFNAKIDDFGIAKMLMREGELQTMSNIGGSFGYMAPEYEYTIRVSEKIDVYSFGVVLLELATGKEPNSREENMNLVEWSRNYYKEKKHIEDALDVEVVEDNCIEEMLIVFKLGLRCTSLTPSLRPSMKDVLQMLHQLNPPRWTHQDNHDVPPFLPEADHTHEDVI